MGTRLSLVTSARCPHESDESENSSKIPAMGQAVTDSIGSVAVSDTPRAVGGRLSAPFRSIPFQLVLLEGGILATVLVVMSALTSEFPNARADSRLAVAVAIGIFATGGLIEAVAAIRVPKPYPGGEGVLPPTTAIIPAFLPNEESIILETIQQHLSVAGPDLQLIVAYNTPRRLPVEDDLAALASREPRLKILKVEHSTSKAENVNAALEHATGEIIAVFDSDHHPAPGNYERAWRWLASGADVVQGRCAVRRQGSGTAIMSRVVAAEFEQMYSVGHPGRSRLFGFGLFGGSNGYWRADALRAIRLDPTALTEDIDASVRLLRSGGRIISDPGIVSSEMAPPTMSALFHQRLRWGQGWYQVARRHLTPVVTDRQIGLRQRLGVVWMFGVGIVMAWIGAFVLPLSIAGWISSGPSSTPKIAGILFAFGTVVFLVQIAVAYRHALPDSRRASVFVAYILANLLFYAYLRVALVRLSHLHELAGLNEWRVTPRA